MAADPPLENIAHLLAELQRIQAVYSAAENTLIPTSIRSALAQKWELAFNAIVIEALLHYAEKDQDADRQRVVRLDKACEWIEVLEDSLIQSHVQRQSSFIRTIKDSWTAGAMLLWQIAKSIWKYGTEGAFWKMIVHILYNLTATVTIALFASTAVQGVRDRGAAEKAVRKLALPQRKAKRYLRRKRTNTCC